jgi:inosine/xanthosine triphosphatase
VPEHGGRIGVGSRNHAKVTAARAVFLRLGGGHEVVSLDAKAAVGDNPIGDQQTRLGAEQRARGVLAAGDFLLGIGMEGGIAFADDGRDDAFLMGWCVVVDRYGRVSAAAGARVPFPPAAAKRVRRGEEAGPVMAGLAGDPDLERRGGAIGYLTASLVPRQLQWETALAGALAPWLRPRLYGWDERVRLGPAAGDAPAAPRD